MFKNCKLLLALMSMLLLGGCTVISDISLDDINSEICEEVDLASMKIGDNKSLKRYFGLNSNDFEDVIIYTPNYTMDVEELLLVKVSNEDQIDIVEQAIESRVSKQIETFGSYGPEQCAILEDYELIIAEKYVFYVASKNAEDIVEAFKKSIYS